MRDPGKVAHVHDPTHVARPVWREFLSGLEFVGLHASPIFYGWGVPRGNGEPVVLVPGFMGSDFYLVELYLWLRRIGYTPYMSHIGHNAQCPDVLTRRLLRTVDRAYMQSGGRKVHLVGHSLGGVFARGAACMAPGEVASVITLGSPFRGLRVTPFIGRAIELVRMRMSFTRRGRHGCFSAACTCGFTSTMRSDFPAHIPQAAIYTRNDGIVDWESCINNDANTDIEVRASHLGLAWNADVYRIIAQRLEEARIFIATGRPARKAKSKGAAKPKRDVKPAPKPAATRRAPVRPRRAPQPSPARARELHAPARVVH